MLTAIFIFLMIMVVGKLIWLAFKMAWGLTKIVFRIVFLPITLIFLFVSGLVKLSLVLLVIIGLISVFGSSRG